MKPLGAYFGIGEKQQAYRLEDFDPQRAGFGPSVDPAIAQRALWLIYEQLDVKPEDIRYASSFYEDLRADSLDMAELAMKAEEEFGLAFGDERVDETLTTVGKFVEYVAAKLARQPQQSPA